MDDTPTYPGVGRNASPIGEHTAADLAALEAALDQVARGWYPAALVRRGAEGDERLCQPGSLAPLAAAHLLSTCAVMPADLAAELLSLAEQRAETLASVAGDDPRDPERVITAEAFQAARRARDAREIVEQARRRLPNPQS